MLSLKSRIYFMMFLIITCILLIPSALIVCTACNCDQSNTTSIGGISDPVDNELRNTSEQSPAEEGGIGSAGYNNSSLSAENNASSIMASYLPNTTEQNITHTIMHPTQQEMSRWVNGYNTAQRVYLSSIVGAELAQAAGVHFSLLNYLQYTPSERNQGSCGNCWAWAGTGVMEIDHAYQTGIDDRLSVQYLNSNVDSGKGSNWACCGGWLEDFANFYSSTKMAIPWSNTNARWQDGSKTCESGSTRVPASSISTNPNYYITSIRAETIPTQGVEKDIAIDNIKNVLHQGKAVWFGFFLPNSNAWNNFFQFWDAKKEDAVWQPDLECGKLYNNREGGGHAILCVGYDDTDPNNRYWIMLNSWGASSNRPNGLFLMNMDMNYDCVYAAFGNAFYWMTLDISYASDQPSTPSMPSGPASGSSSIAYTYKTSAVDPNGGPVKYTFDWGDETTSVTDSVSSGASAGASHSWSEAGTYPIRASAMYSNGISSGWSNPLSVTISANNPPNAPSVLSGPNSGKISTSYSYSALATDPDKDKVKYTFDWGDGTASATDLVNSGVSASVTHKWSKTGVYQVRAMAVDSNAASSGWSNPMGVKISRTGLPPSTPAKPSGTNVGLQGRLYSYATLAKDPNGGKLSYIFDWGDGTTSKTGSVASGKSAKASHKWSAKGTYRIAAKAVDDGGVTSAQSAALAVKIS
jgi:C1A family cysteine protease